MKLEEATKEELIWWIKEHSVALSLRPSEFENAAQRERIRLLGLANKCMDRVLGALEE